MNKHSLHQLLLVSIFLGTLLAGCSPLGSGSMGEEGGGPTRVRGQVLGAGGQAPVPRPPQVQLWARARGGGLTGGGGYALTGPAQATNAQGQFDFSFSAEPGQQYTLRAADGGLGYYTDWNLTPALRGGQDNADVRLLVYSPAWIRLDLVDEPPRSRVWMYFSGFGGNGLDVPYPCDTTLVFRYLTGGGRESFIYWRITDELGKETRNQRTFIQPPLDTQRIRIAF